MATKTEERKETCPECKGNGYVRTLFEEGREELITDCNKCEKEFEPKDEFDMFCGDECKQEALADLDKDRDECLSCQ